jgi:hypothetical protein
MLRVGSVVNSLKMLPGMIVGTRAGFIVGMTFTPVYV